MQGAEFLNQQSAIEQRVRALGYNVPIIGQRPYQDIEREIPDLNQFEGLNRLSMVRYAAGDNRKVDPATYLTVGAHYLQELGVPPELIQYYSKVTIPALVAMHRDHAMGGFTDIIYKVTKLLGESHSIQQAAHLTNRAVSFVEQRPQRLQAVSDNLQMFLADPANTGQVKAVAVQGGYARGDAHLFSDVDLILFTESSFMKRDDIPWFEDYAHDLGNSVTGGNSLPDVQIWGGVFPIEQGEAFLKRGNIDISIPSFAAYVHADNPARQQQVNKLLRVRR